MQPLERESAVTWTAGTLAFLAAAVWTVVLWSVDVLDRFLPAGDDDE